MFSDVWRFLKMLFFFCCAVILFLVLPDHSASAAMFSLNGTVSYSDSKAMDVPVVNQQYRLSASRQTYLTRLIEGGVDFNYSKTLSNTGSASDTFSPAAHLGLSNEFFNFNLLATYSSMSRAKGDVSTNTQWQMNVESLVDKKFWPRVSLSADQQIFASDAISAAETKTSTFVSSVSWQHKYLNVNYSMNINTFESGPSSSSTNTSHFARLSSSSSFFAQRLSLGGDFQFSQIAHEFSSQAGSTGFALAPDINIALWAGADPDGLTVVNTGSLPVTLGAPPGGNLALVIEGDFRQSNTIYIYTSTDQTVNRDALQWDVYVSTAGQSQSWTLQAANVPVVYDAILQRFALQVGDVQGKDVKLLVRQSGLILTPPGSVTFSRVELYRRLPSTANGLVTEETQNGQYRASFNISGRPSRNVVLSYFVTHENATIGNAESSSLSQNVSAGWMVNRYSISGVNLQVSDFRKSSTTDSEDRSRSYSASVASLPLPAVTVNLALTRSESYAATQLQAANHTVTLSGAAKLYHDLDSHVTISYSTQPYSIAEVSPDSLSSNIQFTARITPKLTCNLVEVYSTILGGADGGSLASSLGVNWRLSDLLSLQSSLNHVSTAGSDGSLAWGILGDLALTRKMAVTFGYQMQSHETVSQSMKMALNWAFSRYISFSFTGNYFIEENKEGMWNFNGSLSMRY